jgi:hypothetical protein
LPQVARPQLGDTSSTNKTMVPAGKGEEAAAEEVGEGEGEGEGVGVADGASKEADRACGVRWRDAPLVAAAS